MDLSGIEEADDRAAGQGDRKEHHANGSRGPYDDIALVDPEDLDHMDLETGSSTFKMRMSGETPLTVAGHEITAGNCSGDGGSRQERHLQVSPGAPLRICPDSSHDKGSHRQPRASSKQTGSIGSKQTYAKVSREVGGLI